MILIVKLEKKQKEDQQLLLSKKTVERKGIGYEDRGCNREI